MAAKSEVCFGDMTARFSFSEETLEYHDGPLAGWIRDRQSGDWYAFECVVVLAGSVWHWLLRRTSGDGRPTDPATRTWISVIEDRRSGEPRCSMMIMEGPPPFSRQA